MPVVIVIVRYSNWLIAIFTENLVRKVDGSGAPFTTRYTYAVYFLVEIIDFPSTLRKFSLGFSNLVWRGGLVGNNALEDRSFSC